MKIEEMNENQKIGMAVLKVVQKQFKSRFNATSEVLLNLGYQSSLVTSDYEDIAKKVRYLCNTMDMKSAFRKFIISHGEIEMNEPTVSEPVVQKVSEPQPQLFEPTEPKVEEKSSAVTIGLGVGTFEKALAETIARTEHETILSEISKNFKGVADQYMKENYGTVVRNMNVTVTTNSGTTSFSGEVLHEKFETILKLMQLGKANGKSISPYLVGEAGTGKNVICKQIAKAIFGDDDHFYFTGCVTQEHKITGFTDANGTYHETQFYKAFKNGGVFMLDEMDASCPDALITLNSALANGYFDFPAPIGKVEAHKDFYCISAGNTMGLGADYQYSGRQQLDMASLDRFMPVKIDYCKEIELAITHNNVELVQFAHELRRCIKKTGTNLVVSYRALQNVAMIENDFPLTEVIEMAIIKNLEEDDVMSLIADMDKDNKYVKAMYNLYK